MSDDAFFHRTGDASFHPTALTRGPWSPDHQHGGPPCALLGKMIEERLDASYVIARMIIRLPRPVPIEPLEVMVDPLEGGRNVKSLTARLMTRAGKVACAAEAMVLTRSGEPMPSNTPVPVEGAGPEATPESGFPFFGPDPGYDKAMEVRFARGTWGTGDVLAWMRMRVPLVHGETPSPLVRALTAADSGSGVSQRLSTSSHTFVNPDIVLSFSRAPRGEWIGLEARTDTSESGLGLADTRLLDVHGGFGRAVQTLLVRRR
jgi:hypothetical protein